MTRDWKKLYEQKDPEIYEDDIVYSKTAMDHFANPRNVGRIADYHGMGKFGDPSCGDSLEITIRVDDNNVITDIGFLVFGCAGAISTSSMATEMVKGRTMGDAFKLTDNDVIESLGGLPEQKRHCSLLALEALRLALTDVLFGRKLIAEKRIANFDEYRKLRQEGKIRFEFRPVDDKGGNL